MFVKRTEAEFCENPKRFWDFVRKNKNENSIPRIVCFNNKSSENIADSASFFSNHFNSVYDDNKSCLADPVLAPHLHFNLPSNCVFSVDDVERGLALLKNTKSTGPDGLSGIFIHSLISVISFPLYLIFRKSLDEGIFPEMLKLSSITPIHKSGCKTDVSNYRPISILSHFAKLFESIVLRSIQPSVNSVLCAEQHGFRPGRSTVTCGLVFTNYVMDAFSVNTQVDALYLDFSKAFDVVNHKILLDVLKHSGFGEPLLSWFGSYLSNRKQFVKVYGIRSCVTDVPSGVPQGGHLSPLLFSLFINSVTDVVRHSKILLFADDLKLFLKINTIDDCNKLNEDLNSIVLWASSLGLSLNVSKCTTMSFFRSRRPFVFDYNISGCKLVRADSTVKDLGIVFDTKLTFYPHIEASCCKALKTLGFVKRVSSQFKLVAPIKSLYCALVRSVLEYASVLWDPHTITYSYALERVQRKFLSFAGYVLKIDHPPHDYSYVLASLHLSSLADRRIKANLGFLSNLISGLIDSPCLLQCINFKVPSFSSRCYYPFYVPVFATNFAANEPLARMMRIANAEPAFSYLN